MIASAPGQSPDGCVLVATIFATGIESCLQGEGVEPTYTAYTPFESGSKSEDEQLVGIELEPFYFDPARFLCFDVAPQSFPIDIDVVRKNVVANFPEPRKIVLLGPEHGNRYYFSRQHIILSVVARTNTVASGGGSRQPASPKGTSLSPLGRWQSGQVSRGAGTPPRVFVSPSAPCESPILPDLRKPAFSACGLRIGTGVGRLLRSTPVFAAPQHDGQRAAR